MLTKLNYNKRDLIAYFAFLFLYSINLGFVYIYDIIPSFILFGIFFSICVLSALKFNNKFYIILLFVSIFLILSSFYGQSPKYGLFKLNVGLLLPMSLVSILISFKSYNREVFLRSFIHFIVFIDFLIFFIKIKIGFWERAAGFGLFGPITFAWLNCYLFVITLNRNKINIYLLMLSFIMIIWSGSKGPFLVSVFMFIYKFRKLIKFNLKNFILTIIPLSTIIYYLYLNHNDFRIIKAFVDYYTNKNYLNEEGSGSLGSRVGFWIDSINIWMDNIFTGVGFGNWENLGFGHRYPHNILLELVSETGIIITFSLVIIFIINKKNYFIYLFITGLICQLFSGDFSYFRYYVFFFLIETFNLKKA